MSRSIASKLKQEIEAVETAEQAVLSNLVEIARSLG
jgi:hypothetical protein